MGMDTCRGRGGEKAREVERLESEREQTFVPFTNHIQAHNGTTWLCCCRVQEEDKIRTKESSLNAKALHGVFSHL